MGKQLFVVDVYYNEELYSCEWETEQIETRANARKELKNIIKEIIEEMETEKIEIYIFGELVFKNGKIKKSFILYSFGKDYIKYYKFMHNLFVR